MWPYSPAIPFCPRIIYSYIGKLLNLLCDLIWSCWHIHNNYVYVCRNKSDEADGHQRVCLHVEVLTPVFGKVGDSDYVLLEVCV